MYGTTGGPPAKFPRQDTWVEGELLGVEVGEGVSEEDSVVAFAAGDRAADGTLTLCSLSS